MQGSSSAPSAGGASGLSEAPLGLASTCAFSANFEGGVGSASFDMSDADMAGLSSSEMAWPWAVLGDTVSGAAGGAAGRDGGRGDVGCSGGLSSTMDSDLHRVAACAGTAETEAGNREYVQELGPETERANCDML